MNVKTTWSIRERLAFRSKPMPNGCIEWTGSTDGHGYGQIRLLKKSYLTHRLAYEFANEPLPYGGDTPCVLHKCDNPLCLNPKHLFLGTRTENAADKVAKNRQHRKLTDDQVKVIKHLLHQGKADRAIARQFNVAKTTIRLIRIGRTWVD